MSPSIFDMFETSEETGTDDPGFPAQNLDQVLDKVISERPVAGRPVGFDPSGDGGSSTPPPEVEGGQEPAVESSPPPTPPPVAAETPPPAADPLADLGDLERLELSQLRQALRDPERAIHVRRALLGVEAPPAAAAPVAAQPAPPAEPSMPEEIEPGSVEAQLWQSNQDLRREMAELKQGQQAQAEQSVAQQRNDAAVRATQSFASRYAGKLTTQEIEAIAQTAGMRRLPDAFRPTTTNWDEAMNQALEFELRSNDTLLAKVLGVTPATTPTPGQRGNEAVQRGRQLTALSSAATPSGETATRAPIEHRGDGKLTEKSRMQIVQEMINGDGSLRGSPGEGIS